MLGQTILSCRHQGAEMFLRICQAAQTPAVDDHLFTRELTIKSAYSQDDHLTKHIFGGYVSRYDFKRSEEDNFTVKLVYENRGEKLGIARLDLNDRIAEAIARAELDPDKEPCSRNSSVRITRSLPPATVWTSSRPISSSMLRQTLI
jgi:hypothetical protein